MFLKLFRCLFLLQDFGVKLDAVFEPGKFPHQFVPALVIIVWFDELLKGEGEANYRQYKLVSVSHLSFSFPHLSFEPSVWKKKREPTFADPLSSHRVKMQWLLKNWSHLTKPVFFLLRFFPFSCFLEIVHTIPHLTSFLFRIFGCFTLTLVGHTF